ncbi:MAG: ABC transporter substrate-binding protein [bacterium]|nr:ABC transporter substrate-binding protein [bacterium]
MAAALLAPPAQAARAAQPVRGGALTVGMPDEPPGLDPTISTSQAIARIVYDNVLQGLVRVDRDGRVVPCLASGWDVSPDGLTYTFHLRPNVTFHDGSKLGAADVVADLQRAMDAASDHTHHEYYASIESIKAAGDRSVVLTLKHRDGNLLFDLARPDSVIYPPKDEKTLRTDPVGTGPFAFVQWMRGNAVQLKRYDGYWDPKLPYLDSVTFRFIPDPQTQLAALQSGQIDAIGDGLSPENALVVEKTPGLKLLKGFTTAKMIMSTNNARAPFNNALVRRAMAYATNRKALVQGAMFGLGTPIGSHATPAEYYYSDLTNEYPYDPARAKALLAQAGYPHGFTATLDLPQPYINERRAGEVLAQQLSKVGITLKLRVVQWDYWLSHIFKGGDYDLTVIAHVEPLDLNIYANPKYYFHYDNPKVQQLFLQAQEATSLNDRKRLYGEIQRTITDDAVNDYLFNVPNLVAVRDRVQNWWIEQPIVALDVTQVYLSQ